MIQSCHCAVTTLLALLACVVACGKAATPSPGRQRLEEAKAELSSSDPSTRSSGASRIAGMCCPDKFLVGGYGSEAHPTWQTPESSEACQELRALLAREQSETVLRFAVGNGAWGPACYESEIPPNLLAKLLDRPGLALELRAQITYDLKRLPPTPETVEALAAQLGTRDEVLQSRVADALASYGEVELVSVVRALDHHDELVGRGAAVTLAWAVKDAPLELPGLQAALDRARSSPDVMTAAHAEAAIRDRERMGDLPEAAAQRLLSKEDQTQAKEEGLTDNQRYAQTNALRYFGVRRAFCNVKEVDDAIARLLGSADKEVASAARRAATLRAARCRGHSNGPS